MKFLIIGCGSIGRRHIANLKSLGEEIIASDVLIEHRNWVEANLAIKTFENVGVALHQKPDVVLICTPPSMHISLAKLAVEAGAHAFIEKPLSHTLDGISELEVAVKKANVKVAVGYNLRFNKGLKAVKEILDSGEIGKALSARIVFGQYLPTWRPWQDYKKSYTASKSLGGGIILDGSHELDYSRWLLGEVLEVNCVAQKVSDLEVETEDLAEITLKFKTGAIANVHLDFINHKYTRNCELIGEKGTIKWDYASGIIEVFLEANKQSKVKTIVSDPNETYLEEIKHFIDCIKEDKMPLVNLEEGKKSLIVALAAKKSAEEKKTIKL